MAAVTIFSDFGAPKNKVCHCFHCFPIYLWQIDGKQITVWILCICQPVSTCSKWASLSSAFSLPPFLLLFLPSFFLYDFTASRDIYSKLCLYSPGAHPALSVTLLFFISQYGIGQSALTWSGCAEWESEIFLE